MGFFSENLSRFVFLLPPFWDQKLSWWFTCQWVYYACKNGRKGLLQDTRFIKMIFHQGCYTEGENMKITAIFSFNSWSEF